MVAADRAGGQPAARRWLLAVGVLVVVVLGAVPIPWVRQLAVALQRLLSTSVGDSFVLVSSPTRGQAIVTRTERDLRWLAGRCRRVAVVAHSQGAAIAHRALRRVPPGERKLASFVTVGSGQTKLVDLESLRDTDAAREVWPAPAGLVVMASSIWLLLDLATSRGAGLLAIALATLVGYLLLAGLWRWWDARESTWTLRRQVARHWTVEFVTLLTGIGALLAVAWLLSAGVSLKPTTELIGLPVFLVSPIFLYALLMPGLRWLLRLLQRFGLARDVDRERSMVPALVPAGAAGLIVLLLDFPKIPVGLGIGLVLTMLCLLLLAATLPPLWSASATMRRLESRLRAWAQAAPGPPVEGPAGAVLEPGGSA